MRAATRGESTWEKALSVPATKKTAAVVRSSS